MTQQLAKHGRYDVKSTTRNWLKRFLVVQRQFMSLVGQYDMDLFTSMFSLLYVPVPGFQLDNVLPVEVSLSFGMTACTPAVMPPALLDD